MKIAVIGGGPAGMMAAITAAENGADVTLFEKNEKLGKKLYITGKGRCNLTNDCSEEVFLNNVVNNKKFLYSAIYSFNSAKTKNFFMQNGLNLKTERGNRVFPVSDKASDVTKTLQKVLEKNNVKITLNTEILNVSTSENTVILTTISDIVTFDKVIIATGGLSYSKTGSAGDGFTFAKKLDINTIPPKSALCEIYTKEDFSSIAGLSLSNVEFSIKNKSKVLFNERGEMLFTHKGVSGPIVLTASSHCNRIIEHETLTGHIDFKPALSNEQLDARLLREFAESKNKDVSNVMHELLPSSMVLPVLNSAKIQPSKKVNQITITERSSIVNTLKDFSFTLKQLAPIEEAIVTSGGIDTKEINPKTMQSKKYHNIYFSGETIDVDATTGGFNIQIAFATGYLAGKYASSND